MVCSGVFVFLCVVTIVVGESSSQVEDKNSIKLPKCCPIGTIMRVEEKQMQKKCVETGEGYIDATYIEIYQNNDTHYWNWYDVNVSFFHSDPCEKTNSFRTSYNPQEVESERWVVLQNGTIYLPDQDPKENTLDEMEYCLEKLEINGKVQNATVFFCVPKKMFNEKIFRGVVEIISAVCLLGLACYKYYEKAQCTNRQYEAKNCFLMFCATMSISVFAMAVVNFMNSCALRNGAICYFLNSIHYYSDLVGHLWIFFFCLELYRNASERTDLICGISWSIGFRTYCLISFGSTFILTVVYYSLQETNLDDPQVLAKNFFLKLAFYDVPIGILCILTVILGAYIYFTSCANRSQLSVQIRRLTRQNSRTLNGKEKMFYRTCCFMFVLMFLIWLIHLILSILSFLEESQTLELVILIILTDLFGIIVTMLFSNADCRSCQRSSEENDVRFTSVGYDQVDTQNTIPNGNDGNHQST